MGFRERGPSQPERDQRPRPEHRGGETVHQGGHAGPQVRLYYGRRRHRDDERRVRERGVHGRGIVGWVAADTNETNLCNSITLTYNQSPVHQVSTAPQLL